MEEEWRDINTKYEVSSIGRVRNKLTQHIYKPSLRGSYLGLKVNNKTISVHTLVAQAFLGLTVNHKDGDKFNNKLSNLEVMTIKKNARHARETGIMKVYRKRVSQYSKEGELIATFESIREASQTTGISDKHISSVCRGLRKTTGGYVWKHVDETPQTDRIEEPLGIDVDGYPNYLVTREGGVYSRKMKKFLITRDNSGYRAVNLCKDGVVKAFQVHQLVARAYLPIIEGKNFVNHKNFIKHDNRAENLEWVTCKENMIHESQRRVYETRQIEQLHKGKIKKVFDSVKQASEVTGVDASSIVRSCKGKQKTAGGYMWKYH